MGNTVPFTRLPAASAGYGVADLPPDLYQAVVEPTPGRHLWWVAVGYEVNPASFLEGEVALGPSDMIGVDGPACYWCDRPFSARLMATGCPGRPGVPVATIGYRDQHDSSVADRRRAKRGKWRRKWKQRQSEVKVSDE